jgi:hypothetical protein
MGEEATSTGKQEAAEETSSFTKFLFLGQIPEFCTRAAHRVDGALDQIAKNDDDRMHSIARLAYNQGGYGHGLWIT